MSPEVSPLRCAACGAPVGEPDIRCPYCHAELATVACPKCFAIASVTAHFCPGCGTPLIEAQPVSEGPLPCPACSQPMPARALAGTSLHACEACGGIWLQERVLEHIVGSREERTVLLSGLPETTLAAPKQDIRYRPCPMCRKLMNRQNYAKVSGVIVDTCRDHGTWFDRDELRRILAFVEGGGLSKLRARELQELKDAQERQQEQQRLYGDLPMPPDLPMGFREREDVLGDTIFSALSRFLV